MHTRLGRMHDLHVPCCVQILFVLLHRSPTPTDSMCKVLTFKQILADANYHECGESTLLLTKERQKAEPELAY